MRKNIIFSLIMLSVSTIASTNSPTEFDHEFKVLRDRLRKTWSPEAIVNLDPSITIQEKLTKKQRYGVCHDYAYAKTLGILGQVSDYLTISHCSDWYTHNILEHFEEVTTPQKGDIVVYYDYYNGIKHTGLVYDYEKGLVESKWNNRFAVFIHPTFHTPNDYGDKVRYYRKSKSNENIINNLQKSIAVCCDAKNSCLTYNKMLLKECDNNEYQLTRKTKNLFDGHLCVDPNTTNEKNQTPLILAAKNGYVKLVKVHLKYGATPNHQDENGDTALHFASANERTRSIELLRKNGASPFIKNTSGKYADNTQRPFFRHAFLNAYKQSVKNIIA